MKYYLLILIVLIGCTKKDDIIDYEIISKPVNNMESIKSNDIIVYPHEKEIFSEFNKSSTICITTIAENNVYIRNYPSIDGEIIYQAQKDEIIWVIGLSEGKDSIDSFEGNWMHITFEKNKKITGWIFSKYAKVNNNVSTPLKFIEFIPRQNNRIPFIKLSYTVNGTETFIELDYIDYNNYYTITWGHHKDNFHYTTIPGSYIIDKNTLELKHITYLGSDAFAGNWVQFTDDFEYLFIGGFKSSFTAWRLKDKKEIFSGNGLKIVNNNTIEISEGYGYLEIQNAKNNNDNELLSFSKKFIEENEIQQDLIDLSKGEYFHIGLNIRCSYNLTTGERKILYGRYHFIQ